MKKRIGIAQGTLLVLLIFIVMAVYIPGNGPSNLIIALLSVATFLFGIFSAFVMQNRHRRLNELRSNMRKDDANYVNIYKLSSIFGKKIQNQVKKHIDDYLVATLDYELKDYHKTNKPFLRLYDFIVKLKAKTSKQRLALDRMLAVIENANVNRKYIEYLVRNTMLKFKWFTLIGLLGVILFSMFYINTNSWPSIVITVLLSTSIAMLLLILRELDALIWKEQKWIWDPIHQLFQELDLVPYYPEKIITLKKAKLKKGTKVRIAHYPNPYPDFTGKKVKIEII
ncbi:MAG: hypothetical protein KAT43_04215 [Nanoarchaeota archaeon]|nr:hypothetical protein [Nanoarchaeota archaeon]